MSNGQTDNGSDQYDVRQEQRERRDTTLLTPSEMASASELLGFSPEILQQSFQGASKAYQTLYGARQTDFSEEEYQQLQRLTNRYQQLTQPLRQQRPIGGRIQGNEFSVSLQGLQSGVSDLITGLQEGARQKELFGDPEKRSEIRDQTSKLRVRADDLLEQAQRLRQGQPVEAMYEFIEQGMAPDDEAIATAMEEQAGQLRQEADNLSETVEQYEGVAGRRQELEGRREEAVTEDAFRREFIQTFGQSAYDATVKNIQSRQTQKHQEALEGKRHENQLERVRIQQQGANQRALLRASQATRDSTESGPKLLSNEFQPRYVKNYVSTYRDEIDQLYKAKVDEFTNEGTYKIEKLPSDQQLMLQRLRDEQAVFDEVALMAEFWERAEFDELPPKFHPTDDQIGTITSWKAMGIPNYLIEVYKEYNRIGFDRPRPMPGSGEGPGGGRTFESFDIPE